MGSASSCCGPPKEDLMIVGDVMGMNKNEARSSYRGFKKQAGAAKIKLDKFTKLVASLNTNKKGDVKEYSKHLFRVLDTDKDNKVSWKEVMVGFHQLSSSGNPDDKLKLVYQMYDIQGTKAVTRDDVKIITKAQFQLQGKLLEEKEINQSADNCFNQCDLNKDGKITEDEFMKAGLAVAEMFELEPDD